MGKNPHKIYVAMPYKIPLFMDLLETLMVLETVRV
jgi:hypothetical protein